MSKLFKETGILEGITTIVVFLLVSVVIVLVRDRYLEMVGRPGLCLFHDNPCTYFFPALFK